MRYLIVAIATEAALVVAAEYATGRACGSPCADVSRCSERPPVHAPRRSHAMRVVTAPLHETLARSAAARRGLRELDAPHITQRFDVLPQGAILVLGLIEPGLDEIANRDHARHAI